MATTMFQTSLYAFRVAPADVQPSNALVHECEVTHNHCSLASMCEGEREKRSDLQ